MADNYTYKRLSLREGTGRDFIEMVAGAGSWKLVGHNAGEDNASYMCTRTWGVLAGLWVSYLEDITTGASALVVFGESEQDVQELIQRITPIIQPYTKHEMISLARGEGSVQDRIRAILRVAVAAGEDFDPESFEIISGAARDPDPNIRNAAAWSTTYVFWPQALKMLRDMAANDPDERVRQSARGLLADFQRGKS